MQLGDLYQSIKEELRAFGADMPDLEARRLIEHHTGIAHSDFITRQEQALDGADINIITTDLKRRLSGEPLSRVLGVKEFWGLEFEVTPEVLDPRADTEVLVEAALKWVKGQGLENEPLRILDLGTGTGCLPIALLSELPRASAVAIDYSHEAALVAGRNAAKHKMSNRLDVVQGSWIEALKPGSFDLIVSNPPYITQADIDSLQPEVKNHDPVLALSGGKDGLECYKKIIFDLKNNLNHNNRAFLEIGFDQLKSLTGLVEESGLCLCDSYPDIAGIPRVVEISGGDK